MGGVFHLFCFIAVEVYMFKDFNLLCWKEKLLRQPHASLYTGRLKEATPSGFLIIFDSF